MPFQDELSEKVAEIERQAKLRYSEELEGRFGLWVDENGFVEKSPRILPSQAGALSQGVDLSTEQLKYNYFSQTLSEVVARFEFYYDLDSTELPALAATIGGMEDTSGGNAPSTAYDRIARADDEWMRPVLQMIDKKEWSGPAATTFCDDFLEPFHLTASRQMACIRVLARAATVAHRGVVAAQDDLPAIADAGGAALRGDGMPDLRPAFNVTSIIAGVLGFLSGPLGVAANAIGLSVGILSQFLETEDLPEREWQVGGSSAPEILMSIWDTLMAFEQAVYDQDRQMASPLGQDVESRDCFAHHGLRLADPGTGDGFGQHTVGTVVPGPIARDEAVVTVVALKQAGSRNLPSAAYQYKQAASQLSEPIPVSFSRLWPQTASAFERARASLRGALEDVKTDLDTAGQDLLDVADGYRTTDEQNAEIMRQIDMIPPAVLEEPPNLPVYY